MMFRATAAKVKGWINRKNALFLLAATAGLLTTTLLMATAPEHPPREVIEKAWPVSTTLAEVSRFTPELQAFGRVESPRHAHLSMPLDAPVLAVHVSEGDSVEPGDPLVTLDATEARLAYARRAAELAGKQASLDSLDNDFASEREVLERLQELQELAERRVARLTELYARQLVSTNDVDTLRQDAALRAIELSRQAALVERQPQRRAAAEAAVRSAQAELDEQAVYLERTVLRAPFAGRITRVDTAQGDRVQPGKTLVSLYDSTSLRIRARLPSAVAAELRSLVAEDSTISATIAGTGLRAELRQLSSEIEAGSSGVDALFDLPPDSRLEIGRAVDITLQMPAVDGVALVPQQSLHNNRVVYLVENQRLRAIPVTTHGTRRNERGELDVLVSAGALHDGAEILSSDMPQARQGLLVEATARGTTVPDDQMT